MDHKTHFARLREGVRSWNSWRMLELHVKPDPKYVDLGYPDHFKDSALYAERDVDGRQVPFINLQRAQLHNADLQDANLSDADLQGADLWKADLRGANLWSANLEGARVTGVKFSRNSRQKAYQGIRVATCHGSQLFKSFAQDQDYIEELRLSGSWGKWIFWLWWLFADCGRSFIRWAIGSGVFALGFGYLYYWMGPDSFKVDHLPFELLTMIYYSVVTFTTLGFGDIKPLTTNAAMVVMAEVMVGYIMLGGLVSIMANKIARCS